MKKLMQKYRMEQRWNEMRWHNEQTEMEKGREWDWTNVAFVSCVADGVVFIIPVLYIQIGSESASVPMAGSAQERFSTSLWHLFKPKWIWMKLILLNFLFRLPLFLSVHREREMWVLLPMLFVAALFGCIWSRSNMKNENKICLFMRTVYQCPVSSSFLFSLHPIETRDRVEAEALYQNENVKV